MSSRTRSKISMSSPIRLFRCPTLDLLSILAEEAGKIYGKIGDGRVGEPAVGGGGAAEAEIGNLRSPGGSVVPEILAVTRRQREHQDSE